MLASVITITLLLLFPAVTLRSESSIQGASCILPVVNHVGCSEPS